MKRRDRYGRVGVLLALAAMMSACATQGPYEEPPGEPPVQPPPPAVIDTEPTVPLTEHEKVVSALGATQQHVAELEGARKQLTRENDKLRTEIERLQELLAQAEARNAELQRKLDVVFSPPSPTPTENGTQPQVEIYVTQSGDTFAQIAAKPEIYGNSERWQDLYDANRERLGLSKPEELQAGMELEIKRP